MESKVKNSVSLLRWAVTGMGPELHEADWIEILRLAKQYQITLLVLEGAEKAQISVPAQILASLSPLIGKLLLLDQKQRSEAETIFNAFSAAGLDYAPLKGIRLKTIYPDPAARSMGDIDILLRREQLEQAIAVMRDLGFEMEKETPHELVFHRGGVEIELHKCLIPPYTKDYYAYYREDWSFFQPEEKETHCFRMTKEDELVYLISHFAKHYRDGGIGPMHLVDLYLFRRAFQPDPELVIQKLKALRLDVFYQNLLSVMEAWFDGAQETELTAFLTERLFGNGVWGNQTTWSLAEGVKATQNGSSAHVRLQRVCQVVFPGADYLKYAYPVLQKHPQMLPVVWVRRWFDRIRQYNRVRSAGAALRNTTDTNVSNYRKDLEYVGLSYHFE